MNVRVAKEEMAILLPTSLSQYAPVATYPTDEKASVATSRGLVQRLADGLRWVVELPRRRSVLAELETLSDRELSDIGLSRAELTRVFDPAYTAQREGDRARIRNAAHA